VIPLCGEVERDEVLERDFSLLRFKPSSRVVRASAVVAAAVLSSSSSFGAT
jgi:hypothetical protein